MEENKEYNILIVGNRGVGKTTFINKLNKKCCVKKYKFKDCDTIDIIYGRKKYSKIHLNDKIHGAIIMFSLESYTSYKSIELFHQKLDKLYGNIPIIICGNKFSKTKNKLSQEIADYPEFNLKYFEISNNEKKIIRYLSDKIDNKLFYNNFQNYDNFQNYLNKFLETKDKEISKLTAKIDIIKKLISNNEKIIIRCPSNQIDNKLFYDNFENYDNFQNYLNKFLETKDKEISKLTAKIDIIKKLIS
jgi:GTPase SAR1 family protein